jgi:tetratricopeptide (TPR) repeat protein
MDNDVLVAAWHERYLAQPERMRGMIDHMLVAHLAGKPVSSVSQLPRYDRARSFIRGAIEEYVAWAKANPRAHEEPAMLATALAALQAGGIEAYAAHLAMEQLGKRPESQLAAAIVRQADPSVETLQAVLEKMADPESSVGMDIRATILHQQEEHEQAAALYGQVLRTDPSNNEVRMRQAQALEEADKLPEAMEMYRKVHTVDGNPLAANNAAYLTTQLHADDQAKLTAAQEMLSEAVAEEPRAGYLLDTLGYLNLLLGQDEQAVKQLRRAVLSLPGSIEVQAHLGRAEKQNGQYELARWHLQAAIDLAEAKTESDDKLTQPEKNALAEARETIKLLPRR